MSRIHLEIPDDILPSLKIPPARAQEQLRREFAVFLVKEGLLPRPQARRVAQMGRVAFDFLLADRAVPLELEPEELARELDAGLKAIGASSK